MISTPADRSSAVASWMSSTRNPATGPVVKWRLIGLSDPKTSPWLPAGTFAIQTPGCSSSSRRPRTSRKKATVGSALLVRVPTQASLMIRIVDPYPKSGSSSAAQARVMVVGGMLGRTGDYRCPVAWWGAAWRGAMAQRSDPTGHTFLFGDLSCSAALTEAPGDEQAAALVGGFCVAVRQLLAARQAQEVKTIGDALM